MANLLDHTINTKLQKTMTEPYQVKISEDFVNFVFHFFGLTFDFYSNVETVKLLTGSICSWWIAV